MEPLVQPQGSRPQTAIEVANEIEDGYRTEGLVGLIVRQMELEPAGNAHRLVKQVRQVRQAWSAEPRERSALEPLVNDVPSPRQQPRPATAFNAPAGALNASAAAAAAITVDKPKPPPQPPHAALLEPLAHLLEPLVTQIESGSSGSSRLAKGAARDHSHATLALSLVLSELQLAQQAAIAAEAAAAGASGEAPPAAKKSLWGSKLKGGVHSILAGSASAPAPLKRQSLKSIVVQASAASSASRRVKTVVATLREATRADEKELAAVELCGLSAQPGRAAILSAIVEEGGIAPLVELLERGSSKAKEHAVGVLRRVADHSRVYRTAIANAGGIAPLVKLVGQVRAPRPAASVLMARAERTYKHAHRTRSAFPLAALPTDSMLRAPRCSSQSGGTATLAKGRQEAAVALANLARAHATNQAAIAQAGALPHLLRLLKSTQASEPDRLAAASAICALVAQNEENSEAIVRQGGVAPLARFVLPIAFAAAPLAPLAARAHAAHLLQRVDRGAA